MHGPKHRESCECGETVTPPMAKRRVLLGAAISLVAAAVVSFVSISEAQQRVNTPPAWAYPITPPGFKLPPDDGKLRHVPDSSAVFTIPQIRDRFLTKDWHPGDHPPMLEIIAYTQETQCIGLWPLSSRRWMAVRKRKPGGPARCLYRAADGGFPKRGKKELSATTHLGGTHAFSCPRSK